MPGIGIANSIAIGGGAPAPAGWTPASLGGVVFWVRSDLGITLNSTTVSAWANQVGADANTNLVQSTAGNQPLYVPSDANFNGQPSLQFTTAPRYLRSAANWATSLTQPATWFAVARGGAAAGAKVLIDGSSGSSSVRHKISLATGTGYMEIYAGANVSDAVNHHATLLATVVVFNGTSSEMYCNTTTPTATGNALTGTLIRLTLGILYDAVSASWNGHIAEVAAKSGVASASERAAWFAYAASRYGAIIS